MKMIFVKNPSDKITKGFYSPEYKKRYDAQPQQVIEIPEDIESRAKIFGFERFEPVIKKRIYDDDGSLLAVPQATKVIPIETTVVKKIDLKPKKIIKKVKKGR